MYIWMPLYTQCLSSQPPHFQPQDEKQIAETREVEPDLAAYNLDIRHIKGKDNVIAYALSRVA